jgi:anti-sigma B factor antagonist
MDFKVEGNEERFVVRVIGEVTADSSAELRQFITDLSQNRPKEIVLELSELTFIDTSGLGVLVGLRAHARKYGMTLSLANPTPRVMQVLRVTQLSKVFGLKD